MVAAHRYNCSPHCPTAVMMLALWMTFHGTPASLQRTMRSLCVVALKGSPTTSTATCRAEQQSRNGGSGRHRTPAPPNHQTKKRKKWNQFEIKIKS